jgi:hypothetical protein
MNEEMRLKTFFSTAVLLDFLWNLAVLSFLGACMFVLGFYFGQAYQANLPCGW